MYVIANRQIAAPHHAAVRATSGSGQIKMIGIDEHRVAQIQESVGDDVLSEPALIPLLLLHARRENAAEIPLAVLVLTQVDVGTLRLDPTEENAEIEQIAWIVCDRDWSRCEKHRILVVANFDRVDCYSADEAAAQMAEIDFSLDLTFEQGRDHAPHALLAHARMRDAN